MQSYITRTNLKELLRVEEEERKEQAREKRRRSERVKTLANYQMQPDTAEVANLATPPEQEDEEEPILEDEPKLDEEPKVDDGVHLNSIRRKTLVHPKAPSMEKRLLTKSVSAKIRSGQGSQGSEIGSRCSSSTSIGTSYSTQSHKRVPNTPSTQSRRESVNDNMGRRSSMVCNEI
jgi:hypothetical protein